MTRLHKNACFRLLFVQLFDVKDQNKLYTFKDLIFVFLKMVSFVSLSHALF